MSIEDKTRIEFLKDRRNELLKRAERFDERISLIRSHWEPVTEVVMVVFYTKNNKILDAATRNPGVESEWLLTGMGQTYREWGDLVDDVVISNEPEPLVRSSYFTAGDLR